MLPNPPVWNVSTVLAGHPDCSGDGLQWVELQHYQWTEDGLIYKGRPGGSTADRYFGNFGYDTVPSWPTLPRSLQVSYSHGFVLPGDEPVEGVPNLPNGIKNVVIRGAAVFLENPQLATDLRIGEIGYKFDPSGPAKWLDETLLGQYRLVNM